MARFGGGRRGGPITSKPKDAKKTLKRILKLLLEFKKIIIPLLFIILVYTCCSVGSSVVSERVIKYLGTYDTERAKWTLLPNEAEFTKWLIILIGTLTTYVVVRLFSDLFVAKLTKNLTKTLRKRLFNRMVKLPIAYTDTHPHGDIMSRCINDVDAVTSAVSNSTVSIISGVLQIIGCFGVMLYFSPLLTAVSMGVLLLTLGATLVISKTMSPLHKKQHGILGQLNSEAEEMVSGSKTVMAYNRQQKALQDFSSRSDEMTKVGIKASIIGGSMGPVMNFISNVGYFLICICGALFMLNGVGGSPFTVEKVLTVSAIITFLHTVRQFNRPINEIAQILPQIISGIAAAERIFEVLDEQEESFDKKKDFSPNDVKGIIDFNHIKFEYIKDHPIIKDFNIDVWSGHKIALVGATGSGKTTIVNLLLRFYDINSGKITIDGTDIMDISKKDLRDCISIVLQDPVLFQDSIENNIKYAKENATDEEVDAALEFANCKKFVNRLPEGKKTILTEGATNISQGQRQLLTIARAVLADPKILILDEATSSVDTRTEKKIQDAMIKLMQNRTSIIIAHRLSTIQDADLIIVMDDGHIVEMGDHKQLLEKDGIYNKLYQTQFAGNQI